MAGDLPQFYFRLKENGASVFKIDTQNRQNRLELEEIASLNLRNGKIKPHGERPLLPCELQAIETWLAAHQAEAAARELGQVNTCIEALNHTSHWVQSRATPAQLETVSQQLLLAMHDLRQTIVRKQADHLMKKAAQSTASHV